MSQLSYANFRNVYPILESDTPTYFGFQRGCLDMHTMRYRVFGAVWKLIGGRKYILGFWFADQKSEIFSAIKKSGFIDLIQSQDEIKEIYQTVRSEQDKENWSKRSRLRLISSLKKPWRDLSEGWYVIKSCNHFPCILTCIHKKRYSIWIEHIQVCESQNDAIKFINSINIQHNIQLESHEIYMFQQ